VNSLRIDRGACLIRLSLHPGQNITPGFSTLQEGDEQSETRRRSGGSMHNFTGRLGLAAGRFPSDDFHFQIDIFPRYESVISYRDKCSAANREMHFTL
jgi:hypothetical protein